MVVFRASAIHRCLLPLVLLGAAALSGLARAAPGPDAAAPIQQLYETLQDAMNGGVVTPFVRRFGVIAPAVDRAFDLSSILQIAIGARWDSLSPEQRSGLLEAFRCFTIATYAAMFDGHSRPHLTISPDQRSIGVDERLLQTQILPSSGPPRNLDYVMRQTGGQWRVIDVLVDGTVSQVATQRSDFRRTMAEGGAEGLEASFWRKTADFCSGEDCLRSLRPKCRR